MPPVLSSTHATRVMIWLLLVTVGVSTQDHQSSLREFFGIPYKHPVTPEIEAARAKAYDDMLWIQGVMSGSIVFLFLAGLYSLMATAGEGYHLAKDGQKLSKKETENDERLLRKSGSWTFEVE